MNIYLCELHITFLKKKCLLEFVALLLFDKFIVELNQKDLRLSLIGKTKYRGNMFCQLILKCQES